MDTSAYKDAEYWGQEIAHLHARIDDFEARFEAECHILRRIVDTQIEELRATMRKVESEIAAVHPDAYMQRVADQVAELKLKGDLAYELLQERLSADVPQSSATIGDTTPDTEPPPRA
jgi:uncharacterized protein YicC (UPF0701 family)